MNNQIARHAYIRAGIQRDHIQGRRTPQHILQELQRIETKAQAMYTPQELQQAMAASTAMQAQYLQRADIQSAQREANTRGFYADQLAKDLTGMTADQIAAVRAGNAMPVKGKGKTPYKENLRGMLYNAGLGDVPYEKFLKVADRVEEIKMAGKDPTSYLKQHFGQKADTAGSLIGAFHISGIGIEVGISGEPEADHYEKPTEDLQRRTEIADAWARKASDNPADFQSITSRIDQSYLESDTSQGDVARAFAKHEADQDAQDRASYSAPTYEIDESAEVDRYATI